MKRPVVTTFILLGCLGLFVALNDVWFVYHHSQAAKAANDTSSPSLDKLLAVIRPSEGEDPFATIPWETSLWDARIKAAKLGKPLLLWEMDGHPLGCG
ncbi:hypothetical protein BH11PLA2_BH11PLA2_12890 [soil metagenome]